MKITREIAKVLVTLTPEQVVVLHPMFKPGNWEFLEAWADGRGVMINGEIDGDKRGGFEFSEDPNKYTIVQPTIRIGEIDVPAPETAPLTYGQDYWVADPLSESKCQEHYWIDSEYDHIMLERRRIHLTKAAAVAHADAEILAAGGKV